jgi:phosphohistidine phosphatase SixA
MTSAITRTVTTASAMGARRRRFAPEVNSDRKNSRVRDRWQESANQVVEVGQVAHEQRLAELRRALSAPAWAAAVAALQQGGGAG